MRLAGLEHVLDAPEWGACLLNEAEAAGAPFRSKVLIETRASRVTRRPNARRCCVRSGRGFIKGRENESVEVQFVLVLSIFFQFASTVLAIRLVRVTGGRWAWGLIASVIALMALRRSITGYRVFSSGVAVSANLPGGWVALLISVLIFCGLASISRFFSSIRRAEATL